MWLSRELLSLATSSVYRTAPWQTQNTTGGEKTDRSCYAADTYPVEIGAQTDVETCKAAFKQFQAILQEM